MRPSPTSRSPPPWRSLPAVYREDGVADLDHPAVVRGSMEVGIPDRDCRLAKDDRAQQPGLLAGVARQLLEPPARRVTRSPRGSRRGSANPSSGRGSPPANACSQACVSSTRSSRSVAIVASGDDRHDRAGGGSAIVNRHAAPRLGRPASGILRRVADIAVTLLGGFSVAVDGEPVPERAWRLKKARELVKLLALAPDHRLHREQVMDVLWRDREPAAAANNLHQAVHVARRALDPDAIAVRDEVLFLVGGRRRRPARARRGRRAADGDAGRLPRRACDLRRRAAAGEPLRRLGGGPARRARRARRGARGGARRARARGRAARASDRRELVRRPRARARRAAARCSATPAC